LEVFVKQSRTWLPMLLVISALIASGCLPNEMPTQPTATPTYTPEPQPMDDLDNGGDAAEADPPSADTAPEATPFDLTQLHATDPDTVNLGSGRPVLLEFFAFW
jgi:hypothetical protein